MYSFSKITIAVIQSSEPEADSENLKSVWPEFMWKNISTFAFCLTFGPKYDEYDMSQMHDGRCLTD